MPHLPFGRSPGPPRELQHAANDFESPDEPSEHGVLGRDDLANLIVFDEPVTDWDAESHLDTNEKGQSAEIRARSDPAQPAPGPPLKSARGWALTYAARRTAVPVSLSVVRETPPPPPAWAGSRACVRAERGVDTPVKV